MFELPEVVVLSQQMKTSLKGKVITHGSLGNSSHKFVWYNRSPDEFSQLVAGKTLDAAYSKGRCAVYRDHHNHPGGGRERRAL